MKSLLKLVLLVIIIGACSKSNQQTPATDEPESPGTLYNKVMDIHNEVMPHMGEIERLKRELKEKITKSPDMVVEKKKQLTQIISNLDSAGAAMMTWMHEFDPLPDTASEAAKREYLESEMERVKEMRDLVNHAIHKAREAVKD